MIPCLYVQARTRVYVATGDDQQLNELHEMLRSDFLQEVAHFSKSTHALGESMHNDASLQFAWETIQEQKKEIVRLRAANQELKRSQHSSLTASSLGASGFTSSFISESPTKVINLLRSQLSTHHDNNLHILQDHIVRLEQALQQATTVNGHSSRHDASNATFDSSQGDGKENWRPKTGAPDFSQSLRHQRCNCDHCRRNAASLLSLQSEVKQLRAQVASDEDGLVRAEQDHSYLKRENAALTNTLFAAKQQQEELRQMVSDLTHEKQQLQTSMDSHRRTAERNLNMLKRQVNGAQERLKESEKQSYQLETDLTNKASELQSMEQRCNRLESSRDTLSQTVTNLRESVARLECDLFSSESNLREKTELLDELKIRLQSLEKERALNQSRVLSVDNARERDTQTELMKTNLRSIQIRFEDAKKANSVLSKENDRLQLQIYDAEKKLSQQKQKIEGLQQETRLHDSLQKAGFETSRFKQQELESARGALETLKCELESAQRECKQLAIAKSSDQAKITKLQNSLQTQLQQNEALQEQLSDICSRYMDAQAQIRSMTNSNQRKMSTDEDTLTIKLRQEIADSKTTILMWMSKFNAIEEEKKRLEQNNICLSEDNFSLQRQSDETRAKYKLLRRQESERSRKFSEERDNISKANDVVLKSRLQGQENFGAELQCVSEDNTPLGHQADVLKDALAKREQHTARYDQNQQTLESWKQVVEATNHRNNGLEQQLQDKAREIEMLSMLVHTLESRPKLQGRIFQDLLASSERQFEQVLSKVTSALHKTSVKLSHVGDTLKLASERSQKRRMAKSAQSQRERVIMDANGILLDRETMMPTMTSKINQESQEMAARYDHMCHMIKGLAASIESDKFQELVQANQFKNPVNLTRAVFAHVSTILHSSQVASAYEIVSLKSTKSAQLSIEPKESSVRRESPSLSRFIPVISLDESSSYMRRDLQQQIIYQRWHFLITVCAMIQRIRGKYQACKHAVKKLRSVCRVQRIRSQWNDLANRYVAKSQSQTQRNIRKKMTCIWKQQYAKSCCHWNWQRMFSRVHQKQRTHFTRILLLRVIVMNYKYQQLQLSRSFKLWRLNTLIRRHEENISTSKKHNAATSLTTVAIGKCVALLQQFCEEDTTDNSKNVVEISESGKEVFFQDTELLGKYLIASTKKIAQWKFLLSRNTDELTERKDQMERLQARCTELKELLEMNQRLVSEMESNAASRLSILEAVSRFATAFKGLGSPANVHLMKAQTFLDACQAIVNVAHTFRLTVVQADSAKSKTQSSTHGEQSFKKVWFQSKNESSITSMHEERQALTVSNIELLESVVGSLRNVNASRVALQNSLRTQSNTLQVVKTQLSSRTKQLMVLRAFLRWKSQTREIRRQTGQQQNGHALTIVCSSGRPAQRK